MEPPRLPHPDDLPVGAPTADDGDQILC